MRLIYISLLLAASLSGAAQTLLFSKEFSKGSFALVNNGQAAVIATDSTEAEVVGLAAEMLAGDAERLTGMRPAIIHHFPNQSPTMVVGTVEGSSLIRQLAKAKAINPHLVQGKWETYCIQQVRFRGRQLLVVMGSDPRGAAYGLMYLIRKMGISPWVWWADVDPEPQPNIFIKVTGHITESPSVRYRGIFINDEDWGLQPWAARNMDTDVRDIGPRTYERIFQLMLRLRANYLWPAMHPSTKAFWYYRQNPEVARRYGIVLGASHCEPLLRNNVDEWQRNYEAEYGKKPGEWNWRTNREAILRYWRDRVLQSARNDAVYTIGMRGIHDSSMPGYKTNEEKREALCEVISVQRQMLAETLHRDAKLVPQIFCPYKEALTLYRMGIDLPDDVTLLWPDDNFGYIRQLSTPEEQKRTSGGGVYYHLSYWGMPCDFLWLSTVPPALISYEMTKAYERNCRTVWVFNVGDIKPQEAEMQFALDLAWDVHSWQPAQAHDYTLAWAKEIFGDTLAPAIAEAKNLYYALANAGRPEHLHMIDYTEAEMRQRIADCDRMEQMTGDISREVPSRLTDAFFQLVYYPIVAAAKMNKKVLYARLSHIASQQGDSKSMAICAQEACRAYEAIVDLTRLYNTDVSHGKWNGIMDYAPRGLKQFYEPAVATSFTPSDKERTKEPEITKIPADKYIAQGGSPDWQTIRGLGVANASVTVWPLHTQAYTASDISEAPYVEYDIPLSKGVNTITVKCLPTFPIDANHRMRLGTSINDEVPILHDITMEAEKQPWSTCVLAGYSSVRLTPSVQTDGTARLRLYLADPGVTVSEIDIAHGSDIP